MPAREEGSAWASIPMRKRKIGRRIRLRRCMSLRRCSRVSGGRTCCSRDLWEGGRMMSLMEGSSVEDRMEGNNSRARGERRRGRMSRLPSRHLRKTQLVRNRTPYKMLKSSNQPLADSASSKLPRLYLWRQRRQRHKASRTNNQSTSLRKRLRDRRSSLPPSLQRRRMVPIFSHERRSLVEPRQAHGTLIAGGCLVLKSVSGTFWRSYRDRTDGIHVH